jgi:hypothetical protein
MPTTTANARFCVLPEPTMAAVNQRTDEEITAAQGRVGDDMISALESMVQAARAGRLEASALALEAVAW